MELCLAANYIIVARKNRKSAFLGFVETFSLELKALWMRTKYVSNFSISSMFTSGSECPTNRYFGQLTYLYVQLTYLYVQLKPCFFKSHCIKFVVNVQKMNDNSKIIMFIIRA